MFRWFLNFVSVRIFCVVAFSAAMVFSAVECPVKGACRYYSIYTSPISYLWTVPDGVDTWNSESAIKGASFLVYAPNDTLLLNPCTKDYSTGKTTCSTTDSLSHPTASVTADTVKGFVYVKASSQFPATHIPLGMAVDPNAEPVIFRYYTFYVPYLEFSYMNAKGDTVVVDEKSVFNLPVDSSLTVFVRSVIPVGPDSGLTDTTIHKRSFALNPKRGSENLVFTTLAGDTTDQVILQKGVGAFQIHAASAVSGGEFTASGLVNPSDSSYFVNETFPGSLAFEYSDLPSLDSAFIYDANGDGVGDSIIAYLSGKTQTVSLDSFFTTWPNGSKRTQYSGDYNVNAEGTVLELLDVKTSLAKDSATGELIVYVTSEESGSTAELSTVLQDRIGPAIQGVTLIKGQGEAQDTLVIDFNKDLDTSFTEGSVLQLANGEKVTVKAISKDGSRWIFTTDPGTVEVGDSLSVVVGLGDLGLVAADGNVATYNLPAEVTNAGHVYLSHENNGFFDSDGDGKMDSVTIGVDSPITQEELANLNFQFFWLDSAKNEMIITPDPEDLTLSEDGKIISYKLSEKEQAMVMPNLTSIDDPNAYGYSAMENITVVNGDSSSTIQYLNMNDRMAPVITSTFLNPESSNEKRPDRLVITFSESIDVNAIRNPNFIGFVVDGDSVYFDFSYAIWNEDSSEVSLLLGENDDLLNRANPNDSLFIHPSASFSDKSGNSVSETSKTVTIEGDPRVVMETASMVGLDRVALADDGPEFTERFFPEGTSTKSEMGKSLGVMLDVAFSTIFADSSEGELDLDKIGLHWSMEIYTNTGSFVASANNKILCSDEDFGGNCFENAKRLYLRWNLRANSGRKAGVGVYLAQFHLKVYGSKNSYTYDKIFKWGVHGGKNGLSLDD